MMFSELPAHIHKGFSHAEFKQPGMIYFLRCLNCPFARRSLRRIARQQSKIRDLGLSLVFVHMGSDADFREFATSIGLTDVKSISDPDQEYYVAFKVRRVSGREFSGLRVWIRRLMMIARERMRGSSIGGDPAQIHGAFIVNKDVIHEIYRPVHLAETARPAELVEYAETILRYQR